ncbi:unnamed protein product [Amoebophrya sp. A120]|nr:unnamed protein product [Amoebophrya sp. A120]|eukprot:GSA120T00004926001.1
MDFKVAEKNLLGAAEEMMSPKRQTFQHGDHEDNTDRDHNKAEPEISKEKELQERHKHWQHVEKNEQDGIHHRKTVLDGDSDAWHEEDSTEQSDANSDQIPLHSNSEGSDRVVLHSALQSDCDSGFASQDEKLELDKNLGIATHKMALSQFTRQSAEYVAHLHDGELVDVQKAVREAMKTDMEKALERTFKELKIDKKYRNPPPEEEEVGEAGKSRKKVSFSTGKSGKATAKAKTKTPEPKAVGVAAAAESSDTATTVDGTRSRRPKAKAKKRTSAASRSASVGKVEKDDQQDDT